MSTCTLLLKNGSERRIYIDDNHYNCRYDQGYQYNEKNGYLIIEGLSEQLPWPELIAKVKLSSIIGYAFDI